MTSSDAHIAASELAFSNAVDDIVPGIIIESTLFGVLTLLLFFSTIGILRQGVLGSRPRLFMLTASIVMYIASATHWSLNVYSAMKELRNLQHNGGLPTRTMYVLSEVGSIALFFNFWISDMVVMWRACTLWEWSRRETFIFACFVCLPAVLSIIDVSTEHRAPDESIFQPNIWGLVALLVSLISNVWATSLIAYKAWLVRNDLKAHWGRESRANAAQSILVLLTESGFLYCGFWSVFITTTVYTRLKGSTPLTEAVSAAMPQFVGLYPNAIIFLVSFRMTRWDSNDSGSVLSTLVANSSQEPSTVLTLPSTWRDGSRRGSAASDEDSRRDLEMQWKSK